jgi:hypothetical protein
MFPITVHLVDKFQELYLPYQDISSGESLTVLKGCLSFTTFLSSIQIGIKTYQLCEICFSVELQPDNDRSWSEGPASSVLFDWEEVNE